MALGLTAERVRRDVDVVARAGLDLDSFIGEAVESLGRAVPFVAGCLASIDPTTRLMTGARKYGDLLGRNSHDREWGLLEYGVPEPTAFTELAEHGIAAAGVHALTEGRIEESARMSRFMIPHFGYADELRAVCREGERVWGGVALFRGADDTPFTQEEAAFVGSLSDVLALGIRGGMLASIATATTGPRPCDTGPTVLIIGREDTVLQRSQGADERVADLLSGDNSASPEAVIAGLVGAARRYARGETSRPPRGRLRGASGMWLVLHAAPLSGAGADGADVVITIEEARPPEIVPLVVAAFDLTRRERDVTSLVLQGVPTKEIAMAMSVSAYTVQDHLKSVFAKADVRSRRELISRIYFDQYVPRMGTELGPSGWFATADGPRVSPSAPG
ncbi:helix-turn-helix transcriptional regulator [Nocardioides donggukensis]|uniref:Helix-turn-helix transcriptional regulator n=1 Tax=Nocardioides donggukensis TaxID=2774019 RepID=A0A927PZN7_9ACTN|nr:helix-turn-helix transcriptional regulator [Nocardioides donggukensis]MBD8870523.1 helix-turn-helix transcriptional regulator [Nocardioides donggukensis]